MLSLAEQHTLLREAFPEFRVESLTDRRAIWTGEVCPINDAYQLRIDYELPPHLAMSLPTLDYYPRVYVTRPFLTRQPDAELGPLPHVWWGRRYQDQPNLCLFRPSSGEWTYDSSVAATTIPDACEWLMFYEYWLATKRWYGGGDPHTRLSEKEYGTARKTIRRDALSGASKTALGSRQ